MHFSLFNTKMHVLPFCLFLAPLWHLLQCIRMFSYCPTHREGKGKQKFYQHCHCNFQKIIFLYCVLNFPVFASMSLTILYFSVHNKHKDNVDLEIYKLYKIQPLIMNSHHLIVNLKTKIISIASFFLLVKIRKINQVYEENKELPYISEVQMDSRLRQWQT